MELPPHWRSLVNPYLGNAFHSFPEVWDKDRLHCPRVYSKHIDGWATIGYVRQSYGYNAYGTSFSPYHPVYNPSSSPTIRHLELGLGGWQLHDNVSTGPVRESKVKKPVAMMAVGDAFVGGDGSVHAPQNRIWLRQTDDLLAISFGLNSMVSGTMAEYYETGLKRHAGKLNVVFCDGHVESPPIKAMFGHENEQALRRWNNDNLPHKELQK